MLKTVKKFLGMRKCFLLTVPAYYPVWHSRYGEETQLVTRLSRSRDAKIHAIKFNIGYWRDAACKFSTGKYDLLICYKGDDPEERKFYPLKHACYLHIQVGRFPIEGKDHILIDGREVAVDKVARNEGYSVDDFLELRKHVGSREFCIVHFTEFRY